MSPGHSLRAAAKRPFPAKPRRLPICRPRDSEVPPQCLACDIGALCLATGHEQQVRGLDLYVEQGGPIPAGAFLFHEGDSMPGLMVVRSGTVKLFVIDPSGEEQVLGFAMAGDVIGLEDIHAERHGCSARALEATAFCRLPLPTILALARADPALQRKLVDLLSQHMDTTRLLIGRYEAEQRVAAFLVQQWRHAQRHGGSAHHLRLGMPRTDIANYLRLTPETISRMLRRFQQRRLIAVNRREIRLLALAMLNEMGRPLLRD